MEERKSSKTRRNGQRKKTDSEATKLALLDAARQEFAARGLEGARVDRIAGLAGVNKQLVYHYFGSKDELYIAVLKQAYQGIREEEQALDLAGLPAWEAMRVLIEFSFDYLNQNRAFVSLMTDENTHLGQHLNSTGSFEPMNRPIIEMIRETLARGVEAGVFREEQDAFQVYLSIAALSFFYFSNAHTLSRIFGRDLLSPDMVTERRKHVVEFALSALS